MRKRLLGTAKPPSGGLDVAQVNLGALYASGKGVPQDYEQAAHWYHKAAEQGVGPAQYRLGLLFLAARVSLEMARGPRFGFGKPQNSVLL